MSFVLRAGLLTACLVLSWFPQVQAQAQTEMRSGVIALKDGRMVAIRGDFEILGDEVQFTNANGELMSLPADKVDLEKTRRVNAELRKEKAAPASASGDSLFDQVERYKREKASGKGAEVKIGEVDPVEPPPPEPQPENSLPFDQDMNVEEARQAMQEWMDQLDKRAFIFVAVFAVLILAASLVSLITQIYLIFKSFGTGPLWGLALLGCFIGPYGLTIANAIVPFASPIMASLISAFASLLYLILLFAYIMIHCHGSRLKLLVLWLSPLTLTLAGFLALTLFSLF